MRAIITIAALLVAAAVQAHDVAAPPPCESIAQNGPDATPESRQRRRLARALLGFPTCPKGCHFVLIATPEKPDPVYRARNLGLSCPFGDNGWLTFTFPRCPAGRPCRD